MVSKIDIINIILQEIDSKDLEKIRIYMVYLKWLKEQLSKLSEIINDKRLISFIEEDLTKANDKIVNLSVDINLFTRGQSPTKAMDLGLGDPASQILSEIPKILNELKNYQGEGYFYFDFFFEELLVWSGIKNLIFSDEILNKLQIDKDRVSDYLDYIEVKMNRITKLQTLSLK